jgi:hypothetical protein
MSSALERLQSPRVFLLGAGALGAAHYAGAPFLAQAVAAGIVLSQVAVATLCVLGKVLSAVYAWCKGPVSKQTTAIETKDASTAMTPAPKATDASASVASIPAPPVPTAPPVVSSALSASVSVPASSATVVPSAKRVIPTPTSAPVAIAAASIPAPPVATAAPVVSSALSARAPASVINQVDPIQVDPIYKILKFTHVDLYLYVEKNQKFVKPTKNTIVFRLVKNEKSEASFECASLNNGNVVTATSKIQFPTDLNKKIVETAYFELIKSVLDSKSPPKAIVFLLGAEAIELELSEMFLASYISNALSLLIGPKSKFSNPSNFRNLKFVFTEEGRAKSFESMCESQAKRKKELEATKSSSKVAAAAPSLSTPNRPPAAKAFSPENGRSYL